MISSRKANIFSFLKITAITLFFSIFGLINSFSQVNISVCSGTSFTYPPVTPPGTTYTWSNPIIFPFGSITNGTAQVTPQTTITQTLFNNTVNPATATYNVIPSVGAAFQIVVTVNPSPTFSTTLNPPAVCGSTQAFNYSFLSPQSISVFTWTRAVVPGISNPAGASFGNSNSIYELLNNTTTNPITVKYVYNLTTSAPASCSGIQTISVVVNPTPSSSAITTTECSGNTFMVSPANMPANTTYTWAIPTIIGGTITGGSANVVPQPYISQQLDNPGATNAQAIYAVTPTSSGCTGSPFGVTVTVSPAIDQIALTSSLTPPPICSGSAFTYTPIATVSLPTNSFVWQRFYVAGITPTGPNTGTYDPNEILNNNTPLPINVNYAYTLTSPGGCKNTQELTVTVNPVATLSSTLIPPAICSNTLFNYTPTSATPGTSFNWTRSVVPGISNPAATGSGNPNETLINTGNIPVPVTYNYTLITASGCSSSQAITVIVNPTPILTSTLSPAAVCSGILFTYLPVQNTLSIPTFSWNRPIVPSISNGAAVGTNFISETLVNTGNAPVTVPYNFNITANGCLNKQTVSVIVNPTPIINNLTSTTCSNTAFTVNPGNVPNGTLYTWTNAVSNPPAALVGIGAQAAPQTNISQTITNQTLNAAVATFTVIPVTGTCQGASFTVDVTVKPVPVVANQLINSVCSGIAFNYAALPNSVPAGTVYTWNSPVQIPVNIFTGASAQPISQTSISQTLQSNNIITDTAVYTIIPSSNGCTGNSFTVTVPVNPVPIVMNMTDTICSGIPFTLSPAGVPLNTSYTWPAPVSFPFGAVIGGSAQLAGVPIISQTLTNATINSAQVAYTVKPTAGACAGVPFTVVVTVGAPLPIINNQAITICSGNTFNATPANVPAGITYTWNLPTVTPVGSISGINAATTAQTNISQTLVNLSNTTTGTVVYSIVPFRIGCNGNTFTATVTVLPLPVASYSGNSVVCRNLTDTVSVSFTGTSPWSFTYIDNTGSHQQTGITTSPFLWLMPSVPVNVPNRTFTLTNVKDFGCLNSTDTFYFTQTYNPLPISKITSLHGTYICDNIPDTLISSSLTADTITNYQWLLNRAPIVGGAFIDSISTLQAGSYNALLTNQYGCTDTAAVPAQLIYMIKPIVQFSYDAYCINTTIHFTNLTDTTITGPIQWLWNLGDSTSTNSFNAANIYYTGGDRHIRLMATQLNCPANPVYLDTTINMNFPIPAIRMPSVSAYKGVNTPINARILPSYKYRWVPSWGIDYPDSAAVNFNYANTQEYNIDLISPAGCVTADTVLVRVFDNKLVDIFVPKSFTPNGDGVNDILYPYLAGIQTFHHFKIFNRYGRVMFETTDPDRGWDGNFNGAKQPMSIYIWVAEGIATDGTLIQKKGETLLLR